MENAGKELNPFHAPITSEGAQVPVEQHRAVQEVQAAMFIAKKFPRDQHAAFARIMTACERPKLAEAASYSYPRGGSMITGPTIRIAEVMAQNWGNMEFGIRELSQEGGESEVQAYAWDMETNVRQSKTFRVPHKRKAKGSFKTLSDPRDIYEHVANMGGRRLRACILGVIPGDIVDAAVIKCEETLKKGDGRPLEDMIRGMLEKFKEIEISQELIEARLQHKTTAIVRSQLVELGKIYNSIKDGMSKRSDWFDVPESQQSADASDLTKAIKKKAEVEQKNENGTSIFCPYCQASILRFIISVIESGEKTFTCPACKEEGKIEDGLPVIIPPVDAAANDNEFIKEETITSAFRSEWINKREPGFATYVYTNQLAFESAPIKIQEEARLKWLELYPKTPWPLSPDPTKTPEDEELKAVTTEINDYFPLKTVDAAQKNLDLPTNRALSLDESNLLLAECQRLTKGGGEDLA